MKKDEITDNLIADALGSLEADEQRALEAHLNDHPQDAAEARELRDAAATLAYLAEPVEPPAELRARLLERVAQLKATATDGSSQSGQNEAQNQSNVVPFSRPRPAEENPRRVILSRSALYSAALAASLVIAALVLILVILWQRNESLRTELAGLSTRVQTIQGELAQAREDASVLNAPATSLRVLAGTNVAPRARATLAIDRQTGQTVLYASELPQAPAGKAYQLWFIANGKPLPGRVFTVDAQGRATLKDQAPPEGRQASLFAITLEPQSGTQAPTGEKYLVSSAS